MTCLVVLQDDGWAIWTLLTNKTRKLNQEIAHTRVYISLLPAYTSFPISSRIIHTNSILISTSCDLYKSMPLDPKHARLPTQLCTFSLRILLLHAIYHNANVSDVASSSTHSDGTKWQQIKKGEG